MKPPRHSAALSLLVLAGWHALAHAQEPLPETVEFNRDIRPILSDSC